MLTRALRYPVGAIFATLLAIGGLLPATAAEPPGNEGDCRPGQVWNGVTCEDVGDDDGGDGDERNESTCVQGEPVVAEAPCEFHGRIYYQPLDAWVEDVTDAYMDAPDDPIWEGNHPEGAIVRVYKLTGAPGGGGEPEWTSELPRWIPEFPGEPQVNPEDIAGEVLASMDIQPIDIGLAPRPTTEDPDSASFVGLPNWMWVENPSPNTWGPLDDSGSAGGITVTVTAQVESVEWDMGNGNVVTCETPGTPWTESEEVRESPDCGHHYYEKGDYTVTAAANWSATWESSDGASGELAVDPQTAEAPIRIDELQVIRTD